MKQFLSGAYFILFSFSLLLPLAARSQGWTSQYGRAGWYPLSICFTTIDHGWAVGLGGIVHTTNGGIDWIVQNNGISSNINLESVKFVNDSNGWAVGDSIYRTTNGGTTWTSSSIHPYESEAASFSDINVGWIVGGYLNGAIFHTTNSGVTWVNQFSATIRFFYGVTCLRVTGIPDLISDWAWVVGDSGTILHTTNGGTSWINQNSRIGSTLSCVSFTDTANGCAVGQNGQIVHTTNGGANWLIQNSGTGAYLLGVYFIDINNGWVVGSSGTILHTTNAGSSWSPQHGGYGLISGVTFVDNNHGWAVMQDCEEILHYTGTDWVAEPNATRIPSSFSLQQNYPNPFNSMTTIEYSLPKSGSVELKLFDVTGREIRTLLHSPQNPGTYRVPFEASGLSSGTYFYRLNANGFSQTRKLSILK